MAIPAPDRGVGVVYGVEGLHPFNSCVRPPPVFAHPVAIGHEVPGEVGAADPLLDSTQTAPA